MSAIIRPDNKPFSQVAREMNNAALGSGPSHLRIPAIEIPRSLRDDLDVNPHLVPAFYKAVGDALTASLHNPDTKPRLLSHAILRERVEECYGVLIILRREMKWPLRKCFDVLPQQFLHALLRGTKAEDEATRTTGDTAWSRGRKTGVATLNKRRAQTGADEEFITAPVEEPDNE